MSVLVTTLRRLLDQADSHFAAGRLTRARRDYEELLERAQERLDRPMEVAARAMLARVSLRRRDLDAVRDELEQAERLADPSHVDSQARIRATRARLALAEASADPGALESYLDWAEDVAAGREIVDACLLFATRGAPEQRLRWTQRAIDAALLHHVEEPLNGAYNALAAALDQLGRAEEALDAYQQALSWARRTGERRRIVAAGWAVGAAAVRAEDWPLARQVLEEALAEAEPAKDCADFVALALADLAQVYDAAGDVVEARRLVLRALDRARELDFAALWPERWSALVGYAQRLELDPW